MAGAAVIEEAQTPTVAGLARPASFGCGMQQGTPRAVNPRPPIHGPLIAVGGWARRRDLVNTTGEAQLGFGQPPLAGPQERRHFARVFVVDQIFVAADEVGLGVGRRNRGERLRQRIEIAGILQPAVPNPAPRPAQPPDRGPRRSRACERRLVPAADTTLAGVPAPPPPPGTIVTPAVPPAPVPVPGPSTSTTTTTVTPSPDADHREVNVHKEVDKKGNTVRKKGIQREGVAGSTETHKKIETDRDGTVTHSETTTKHE